MTFVEAKNILINRGFVEVNGYQVFDGDKWRNAIAVISKWLEQEPCEDCISRQAVIDMMNYGILEDNIKELPSVIPKEKMGKWIEGGYEDMYYVCSECNYKASEYWHKPSYKYCPNCGAKMEDKE